MSSALVEWADGLADLDADVLVFMARKSFCVYDVLTTRLGVRRADSLVVSDRILDLSLAPLRGRKVALIDDAMILGTTLARTVRLLNLGGVRDVTVHTFCRDTDTSVDNLVQLASVALDLEEEDVRRFCSSEVRMLGLAPRPYVVDFPIYEPFRLSSAQFDRLVSSIGWDAHDLTSDLQAAAGVSTYTFVPSPEVLAKLTGDPDRRIEELAALTKVRAFGFRADDVMTIQLVPMVTLHPVTTSALEHLVSGVAEHTLNMTGISIESLTEALVDPRAAQRLVQYALSSSLGHAFTAAASGLTGSAIGAFDIEAAAHWGPWHEAQVHAVEQAAVIAPIPPDARAYITEVPNEAANLATTVFDAMAGPAAFADEMDMPAEPDPLVEFAEIFLSLYHHLEPAARAEAKKLGATVLEDDGAGRDRLAKGLPWEALLDFFCTRSGIEVTWRSAETVSLLLDICHDLGIAVPITCRSGNILYRAYRYGEDVRFADGELDLALDAVLGYLEITKRDAVPRLVLEKLLVLLIRIGAARGFLDQPLYARRMARIGFHLKGAVPTISTATMAIGDRWLSSYLVRRGVLRRSTGGQYLPGKALGGTVQTATAHGEAREVGMVLGDLLRSSDAEHKDAPLGTRELIVLTTVAPPRDALAALQAELRIVVDWWEGGGGRDLFADTDPRATAEVSAEARRVLSRSAGHEAVHSASMKFEAFCTNEHSTVVDATAKWLARDGSLGSETLATRWKGHWDLLFPSQPLAEMADVMPLMRRAAGLLHGVGALLSLAEISFETLAGGDPNRGYDKLERLGRAFTKEPAGIHPVVEKVQIGLFREGARRLPDAERALKFVVDEMDGLMSECELVAEAIDPIVQRHSGRVRQHAYDYLVWYDVIDSTGTAIARSGGDVAAHRVQVAKFKDFVNQRLSALQDDASQAGVDLTSWNGTVASTNDEKHLFIGGINCERVVSNILDVLGTSSVVHRVKFRASLIATTFVGTRVYRVIDDGEVRGQRFWEHLSRVMRQVKVMEGEPLIGDCGVLSSIGVAADEALIPPSLRWCPGAREEVDSEIEGLRRSTGIRIGRLDPA